MKEWLAEIRFKLAYLIYPEYFDDMEERLSGLLCHTTGGLLSKTNYTLEAMISAVDNYWQSSCNECEFYLADLQKEKGGVVDA